jgi:ribosomal-protein-alanine N-acetyltransferase
MTEHYRLRYMTTDDISQVVEVDKLSFPMPWSPRSYTFEVTDNKSSHMVVVDSTPIVGLSLRTLWNRLNGRPSTPAHILGYGGFWLIDGETHVSTIAMHPDFRGKGLGEVLLSGMIERSLELNAEYAVLEVRVTNESAIGLYTKYGFEIVGQRKNYYRDNNEDAYLMHCSPFDAAYRKRFAELLNKLHTRVDYEYWLNHDTRSTTV